jgi:hypothetical protein
MNGSCAPYQRRTLYLLLTVPMIVMYVAIAVLLWQVSKIALLIYAALFIIVAVGQSYVCVYWQCPYVGKFAPCVGGFCLPASRIALLFKNAKKSERRYNTAVTSAFAALLGIIVLPLYFLYQLHIAYLLIYLGIVIAYAVAFLWLICPVCATRQVCPGGQASTKLRDRLAR